MMEKREGTFANYDPTLRVRCNIVVGIDPGMSGAIAFLDSYGRFVAAHDLKYISDGETSYVDGLWLTKLIMAGSLEVFLERVAAMPKQGVASTFKFGSGFGSILGALSVTSCKVKLVTPFQWKRGMQLSRDKNASLEMARQFYPEAPLSLKKHEGRAEALLLARWGWEQLLKIS